MSARLELTSEERGRFFIRDLRVGARVELRRDVHRFSGSEKYAKRERGTVLRCDEDHLEVMLDAEHPMLVDEACNLLTWEGQYDTLADVESDLRVLAPSNEARERLAGVALFLLDMDDGGHGQDDDDRVFFDNLREVATCFRLLDPIPPATHVFVATHCSEGPLPFVGLLLTLTKRTLGKSAAGFDGVAVLHCSFAELTRRYNLFCRVNGREYTEAEVRTFHEDVGGFPEIEVSVDEQIVEVKS